MGLKEAVVSVFSKYATFSGRATRSEYWFFYLFNVIMCLGLVAVCAILGAIFKGAAGAVGGYTVGTIPGLITERARRSIILCMRTGMMRQKALRVVLQSM